MADVDKPTMLQLPSGGFVPACHHCGHDPIPPSATHDAWVLREQASRMLLKASVIDSKAGDGRG